MSAEQNKELLRRFTACWNQRDLAQVDEFLAPDFVHHDPGRPDILSREDYKRWIIETHSLFPDMHLTIEDMVAEADRLAVRWMFRGTNTGDFEIPTPLPATGKQVIESGINIYRFAGGKIVEEWFEEDALGMMQQLGLLPVPEQVS
jgi:steroid delta-isomerase-like uncharacterized protein